MSLISSATETDAALAAICRLLKEDGANQVVLAPTGVAAINVAGQIGGSFF